ncbi:transposase domain-containing protein [Rhizophagus clarus]|uniref:Transposase domain-containing protein n=1 Tax=Rhizophagus clarus TaxID=94130 RepID=A0A8H3LKS2_9GLOM|nr:transposase domain-containing protein [Rhizophagus clarus]
MDPPYLPYSSDTEILDSESPGYEPIFQEFSNNELLTDDSNSVLSTSTQNESNQDSENENANIQLPPGFPEALRLLEIKSHSNMTNNMYREIIEAFSEQHVSLYRATNKLVSLVSIDPVWIDCCVKSCCAFTGNLKNLQECPTCGEKRYKSNSNDQIGRKKMAYFPLKDRFVIQYQNSSRSLELQYRNNYTTSQEYLQYRSYGDVFDGGRYQELVKEGHFMDYRDIALIASLDGYNIFKQKTDDCWIILFINANIPPENRVKRNNLLIGALIPGPSAPGDLNSFLYPVIEELKELEHGIRCHDGYTNQDFILHCSVVSWSGDTPALAKLMCTTGHNSYQGKTGVAYNPNNLPKRTHQDYLNKIIKWKSAKNNRDKERIETATGVNGQSILFELKSTKFPNSFPIDIMHLLYENIPCYMFRHWYGSFYPNNNSSLNINEYTIQRNQVHPSQNKSRQCNDENIVFTNLNYEEELYFPTTKHHLNKSMVNKLKKQYSTCYETKIILQQEFPENGKKYARL